MKHESNVNMNLQLGDSRPCVSVVLPAYNAQNTISEALLSVLNQTIAQIEIIVINDASTDHTQKVVDNISQAYPGRIQCIKNKTNLGPSGARRTGIEKASAPYLLFLDAGDAVCADICALLTRIMDQENYDILYFPITRCDLKENTSTYLYPPNIANKAALIEEGLDLFCSAMYRRDFLLKYLDIAFPATQYSNKASIPILCSKANRIGVFRKKAVYMHYVGRNEKVVMNTWSEEQVKRYFDVDFCGWDQFDRTLKATYAKRIARQANRNLLYIYDYNVQHLRDIWQYIEPYHNVLPGDILKVYQDALTLPLKIRIPKKVYVNGFLRNEINNFDAYVEQAGNAYICNPEVIILDEKSSDVTRLPSWIKTNEDKGLFMALDTIERDGGVYIAPYVNMISSVNREAYRSAFFTAGINRQVLPAVFGAEPHQFCVVRMLQLMEEREYQSVPYCMTTVLSGEAGVRLNGYEETGLDNVHILPIGETTIMGKEGKCIFTLDYSCFKQLPEDVIAMPRALWDLAIKRYVDTELSSIKADTGAGKQSSAAQREIEKFKKSRVYRYAKKYYRVRDKVKKVAKKILRR